MDDRTAGGRENANREQTAARTPAEDQSSRNGRLSTEGGARADQRSSPEKPALTERERGEPWPLG